MLLKDIFKVVSKWKDGLCSWIVTRNTVKTAVLPKVTYAFLQFLSKSQWSFFAEMKNPIPKFICNYKESQKAKTRKGRTKLEDSNFLISKRPAELQNETKGHPGVRTDVWADGAEHGQTCGPTENTEPGQKPPHSQPQDLRWGSQDHALEKGQSFQPMALGKLELNAKEIGPLSPFEYKN